MNAKAVFCKMTAVILLTLSLVSCGTPLVKGEKWLASKQGAPEINISGTWTSPEWGSASFKQNEKEIVGTLGDYPAKGVVSGRSIYLYMYAGNKIDYFAELKAVDNNTLHGLYSKYEVIEEFTGKDRELLRPVNLKRTSTP
jgi:hypothetical protein